MWKLKLIYCLIVVSVFFTACKKNTSEIITDNQRVGEPIETEAMASSAVPPGIQVGTFATMADLRASTITLNKGEYIELQGYYDIGDGGKGYFTWDASLTFDDGGINIIQNPAPLLGGGFVRFLDVLGPYVDHFGASFLPGPGNVNNTDPIYLANAKDGWERAVEYCEDVRVTSVTVYYSHPLKFTMDKPNITSIFAEDGAVLKIIDDNVNPIFIGIDIATPLRISGNMTVMPFDMPDYMDFTPDLEPVSYDAFNFDYNNLFWGIRVGNYTANLATSFDEIQVKGCEKGIVSTSFEKGIEIRNGCYFEGAERAVGLYKFKNISIYDSKFRGGGKRWNYDGFYPKCNYRKLYY